MKSRTIFLLTNVLVVLGMLAFSTPVFSQQLPSRGVEALKQVTGGQVEITWNPRTGTASFIRGQIPLSAAGLMSGASPATVAFSFIDRYADIFGVGQASGELKVVETQVDALEMTHTTLSQVYQGIEVNNAYMIVHQGANGEVIAISSSFVPGIRLPDTFTRIKGDQALAAARKDLPNGTLLSGPRLVVYPGTDNTPSASAKLVWLVELRDDAMPARNIYFVDANDGSFLDVLDRLYDERDRKTYDANQTTNIPGILERSEGDGPTGDQDVDNAHNFAGATYDYYYITHSRDSYDNQGATIISTTHYGSNYLNAFWNGEQMVYGDGFPVNDVAAHELTHAVTEHTANLEYRWQYGALNESFSDIFGAMVDRNDWLMGEDLPPQILGGREAIRDLSNPPSFDQPDHTKDWVETCSDNEGVHTNSGITNKAYYNIATAITKDKAERIFYRTLTVYLHTTSSLEDARAGALQSAQDLYGSNSTEYNAVRDGFNAVGLDGQWNPPTNDCICAAKVAMTDMTANPDQVSALETMTTLYGLRDQLLNTSETGQYYRTLYEENTNRISYLLLMDSTLLVQGSNILHQVTPGLYQLVDGKGDKSTITRQMVTEITSFLQRLAKADKDRGGDALAQTIEQEMARIDINKLIGITFQETWELLNSRSPTASGPFPLNRIGGATASDVRAADIYPAVAYDSLNNRYLAIWLTARNAQSSSSGLDVYGVFLNESGQPIGSEFRISDNNSVALSSYPTVAFGNGEFVVLWTAQGGMCTINGQRVTDTSARSDWVLVSGTSHNHSPSLAFNPVRQSYVVAFVEGDDYLPPTLYGADVSSCGNNATSTSRIRAMEFHLSGDSPVVNNQRNISDVNSGSYRPSLAYSAVLNQYLVVWEDQRNAGDQSSRFDVYAQRLANDSAGIGANIPLATGGIYPTSDTSATWTPRPAVAGGSGNFLATWYEYQVQGSAAIWRVKRRLMSSDGSFGPAASVTEITFAQSHSGNAPTGFLTALYHSASSEYLVGQTSHLESLWGYISTVRIQRVRSDGQLLNLDGSLRSQPTVGNALDYANDDQISLAMAVKPSNVAEYLVIYGKHAPGQQAQDFDIWGSRVLLQGASTFADVPATHWASSWINRLYNAGITSGCSTNPLNYCPEDSVTRAQMAIFLERGMNGSAFTPPAGTGAVFADVPLSYWSVDWIEKLFADGITSGCGINPLIYCPDNPVTRSQMAIFLLRAKYGAAYIPPAVGSSTGFNDVPVTHWAAAWIKQLAAEGITTGCGSGNYCPEDSVTRAQMAVFLVRTFNLP
jgi:Zn-dependent metalloprotease